MATFTFASDPDPKLVLPVTVEYEIPHKRLSDLLVGAFEGGSNDWYWIEEYVEPASVPIWVQKERLVDIRHAWYPLTSDGALVVSDRTAQGEAAEGPMFLSRRDHAYKEWLVANVQPDVTKRLNMRAVAAGAAVMAEKYPEHFRNFMDENDDAVTADVFLQCCVFGEIVYG